MTKKVYSQAEATTASLEYFGGDEIAANVFLSKYALRNTQKELLESNPDQMHHRIAKELARVEKKKYEGTKITPLTQDEIYDALKGFKRIVPQGSPMYGIGNKEQYVTLSNCYVLDSPLDSYGGIHWTDEQVTQISKRRGGVGLDLSNLRPVLSPTRNSSRSSSGIASWMERYSNSTREVGQDGRRGAQMQTISVHHPEVLTFATIKNDKTKVTGANVSVRLSDEFLKAVHDGTEYEQRWPVEDTVTPTISRMVDARGVWQEIVKNAHTMAEPGLLFWDTIIKNSPADCYADFGFKTISTNPCVTSDTWIFTLFGPRQAKDLIGRPFTAIVNGKECNSLPAGFWETGKKDVYVVTTKRGYQFTCTKNHMLCACEKTRYNIKESWKPLSDLDVGSLISISNHRDSDGWVYMSNDDIEHKRGWLIGNLIGDCHFTEETAKLEYWEEDKEYMHQMATTMLNSVYKNRSDIGSFNTDKSDSEKLSVKSKKLKDDSLRFIDDNKDMLDEVEYSSSNFCSGIISGLFDADGTVHNDDEKGKYVRLSSTRLGMLRRIQRMLSRFGIACTIYEYRQTDGYRSLPDGKGGSKEYLCKANHELHISNDNLVVFYEKINFKTPYKALQLISLLDSYVRRPNRERFVDEIKSIEYRGSEKVYDCCIPEVNEFDGNGVRLHNCSELPLSALDSCRLLLVNLYSYVKDAFTKKASFDYTAFYEDAKLAQRLMDDVIELELEAIRKIIKKIEADPEPADIKQRELDMWARIERNCRVGRRTGTGITALGDTLAALGIPYSSSKGVRTAEKIYKALKFATYESSIEMAEVLGAFECWNPKLETKCEFFQRFSEETLEFDGFIIDGSALVAKMNRVGRRNIALLTTAPAGSVSILTQTTSGIEPLFMLLFWRFKKINPSDVDAVVDRVDDNGDSWQKFKVYHPKVKDWMAITGETDVEKSPWFGSCAEELNWKKRVKLQALCGQHVDHAISSTLNLPNSVTPEEVGEIYETAWKAGCKGITVYRDGCRDGVLVKEEESEKRPRKLPCDVYHIQVNHQEYFVLVGLKDGNPYEVFAGKNGFMPKSIKTGEIIRKKKGFYKALFDGSDVELSPVTISCNEHEETITRLTSGLLRSGANMHFIVQQLEKVGGDMNSFARSVSRALKKYIPDGTEEKGETCPQCGATYLVRQEGCVTCKSCGWAKCM